ncbi:uncharacterized protein E5676_scaffold109G00500 [Cucumis melo var. makuwa]|uniref:Uncharacterized protein n=1 Tax=Cucumis melo var. makuwa TaxID=1194695 RepID=A0A5D3BPC5_CUCMM|nr:uncharacterized protein E6C27_scaffold83G00470 [Cucumis melo var. makuwa]TYK01167.1 uncharacterized protein E5676_scaffold109G00500 [Cucumis melo var. makuwa]
MNSGYKLNIIDHSVHGYEIRWSVVVMPSQKDFPYKCFNDDLGDMLLHYPQSQNGIQQVTLMKVRIHTLDLTMKAHELPLDFHRTKSVRDTNPIDVATLKEKGESSTQKRKRGPTEMKEITRARSEGKKLLIEYNELGQAISQNAMKLKSFIGTTTLDQRRLSSSTMTYAFVNSSTDFVLPFLDDVEKLKFPPNEYSFIDQQHWTEFVASRLKEDFKKKSENGKEKRKKHKYNHRTFRKGYANLMEELDELVATQKTTNAFGEEDILTRALGGKDHPGILRGAENVNDLEDLSNDLESQKDVEDVIELNEEIKVNIAKDDGEVEDVEGDNVKVTVDVVVDGDCAIPIPSEQGMYKMSQEVGSHILWPRDLVITDNIKMDYGEFTKDMTTFAPTPIQNAPVALRFLLRMVEHMGSAIQITTPYDVFGVRRKCCIMIESLKDFTSMRPIATACLDVYIMYLYKRMESSRTLNLYKFVDTGPISYWSSKEERAQLLIDDYLE